jgi:hypothetical protein
LRVFKFLCQRMGFLRGLVDCGYSGFVFVSARREERCVFLRVFSSRRRPAPGSCTTFYKLDLRFTYLTRRNSRKL